MSPRIAQATRWDIYEEHLDEAAFLWGQWERALVAANFALHDVVVGPEARLLAHLDGLVLGGRPVAEAILIPALVTNDAGRLASATWALAQAEDGYDYQGTLLDLILTGTILSRSAVSRSMALAPNVDLERTAQLWARAAPAARASLLELVGAREPERSGPWIESSMRSGDPALAAAALRVARRVFDPALIAPVEAALESRVPELRVEAVATGIAMGSNAAWDACRAAATQQGDGCRLPLGLLASSVEPQDRAIVRASVSDSGAKRHAIWALGFAGDLEAADVLVEAVEDHAVAKIAGESLSAITGLVLGRGMVRAEQTAAAATMEVGEDDPPPVVRPEDRLLTPNSKAVARWWRRERTRFVPGVAHIQGQPRTPGNVHAALATTTMWRREVLWLDLARTTGRPPGVNLKSWAGDQQRQWRERRGVLAGSP